MLSRRVVPAVAWTRRFLSTLPPHKLMPMPRLSPRSEGHCAGYGREPANDTALTHMWRARLHNEKSGMPKADMSGANTTISLVWNPGSKHKDAYQLSSHRKISQLKQVHDYALEEGLLQYRASRRP